MALPQEQGKKKRLIILLPVNLANSMELAHMVHWKAFQENMEVVYFTIENDENDLLDLTRDMATLKAVTSGNLLNVQWVHAARKDWLNRLRAIYQPGDEMMCDQDQCVEDGLTRNVKLAEFIYKTLAVNVHQVPGLYSRSEPPKKKLGNSLITATGFLLIIAFFTYLQSQTDQYMPGTVGLIVVLIFLGIEVGAILAWNDFNH